MLGRLGRVLAWAAATHWAAAYAAPVEIVEAVLPDWPQGEPLTARGTVVVKFVLVPGGEVFITESDGGGLSKAFVDEARLAMREWLIHDDGRGNCGMIHGRQEFKFEGDAADTVTLGETDAWISGERTPVYSLDRVEITGGRIRRSEANDPGALARHATVQDSYSERRYARWKAVQGDKPWTRYTPSGITPPVPKVRIEPQFPRSAIEMGQSGVVVSRLTVDVRGRVAKVEVADSYPSGTFDQASRKALARWQLAPAVDAEGRPVLVEVCQLLSYLVIDEGRFRQGKR